MHEIGAVLLAKHEYTYNGKKNKPSVTVIDVEGNKLVKGTDYSVLLCSTKRTIGVKSSE